MKNGVFRMENGFVFSFLPLEKGGLVAVVDERLKGVTTPVALVAIVPLDNVQTIVNKAISLYKNHQVISVAGSLDEFNRTFAKIA